MAYVPGLTVTENALVRKKRVLPLEGEVSVKINERVKEDDVVARCVLPGDAYLVDVSGPLNISFKETEHYTTIRIGERVEKEEVVAQSSSLFGLFKTSCKSPIEGTCEMISNATGKMLIRGDPKNVEVKAYIPGKVIDIDTNVGATIESPAVFIQGIFGIGGETSGPIQIISETLLTEDLINQEHEGQILVNRYSITQEALIKAVEIGVKGIIVGSMLTKELTTFVGNEIGVAITGNENLGITLILTEGFGNLQMSKKAFNLLKKYSGKIASINGSTQIRAGVIRPEVIIPNELLQAIELELIEDATSEGLQVGTPIRIINEPYFGALGKVIFLPSPLQLVESGSMVRVLEAELENGEKVVIPRANVEMIEWEETSQ